MSSRRPLALVLEPRFVFDAAALATAADIADHTADATRQAGPADHPTDRPTDRPAADHADSIPPVAPVVAGPAAASDLRSMAPEAESQRQPAAAPVHELVFVDDRVEGVAELLSDAPPGVEIVTIDRNRDGLAQIGEALQGRSGIDTIRIVSHGSDGLVSLGSDPVNAATLTAQAAEVAGWRDALTDGADILIYGCDVAATGRGVQFLNTLADLTGADVAASDDTTGAQWRGGDWELEARTGSIEAASWADSAVLASWDATLSGPSISGATSRSVLEPSALNASAGDSVFALTGWTIADDGMVDGVPNDRVTVTVTLGDTAVGTLAGQGTATALGNGFSFSGTVAEANAWLHGVSFQAADTELGNSTAATSLTIQVRDQENLTASHSVAVTVTPSNDPVLVADSPMTATEGATTTVPVSALLAVDPELAAGTQQATQIVYRLSATPTNGYLTLNGSVIGAGSVFTYKNVQDGALQYHHTRTGAQQNDPDSFSVSVNDGATPQANSDTATVSVAIAPVNQAPTVTGSGQVFEGQPANATSNGVPQSQVGSFIVATDGGDPGDSLTVRLTSLTTHGKLYFTGTATLNGTTQSFTNLDLSTLGNGDGDLNDAGESFVFAYGQRSGLTYANDGLDPGGVPPADSFGVEVSDAGGGTGFPATTAGTIAIRVASINDDPTLDPASTLSAAIIPAGVDGVAGNGDDMSVRLTPAMLQVNDTDSPDTELTFTITSLPTGNKLRIDGKVALIGSTFTMQDVRDGKLVFWQHLAASAGDTNSFTFTVRDNALSLRWDAAGEDFQRGGGIYADNNPGTPLKELTFTVALVPTPGAPANIDPPDTAPEIPAPAEDTTQTKAVSLAEGGTVAILGDDGNAATAVNLRYSAEDVETTQIVYTVTALGGVAGGWNGTLQRDATGTGTWTTLNTYSTFTQQDLDLGRIRFVHDGGEDFESTFDYEVSAGGFDQATGLPKVSTGVFSIHVTPVNDEPTATGSGGKLMLEGGTTPVTSDMLSFADPDDATSETQWEDGSIADSKALDNGQGGSNPLSFRVTALPSHGELWVNDGGGWTRITQAMVDAGTAVYATALITADGGTTGLKYVHDGFEDRTDSFRVVARDRWNAESAPATVSFTVTNVNDAPEIAADPSAADPTATGRSPNQIGPATGANDVLTVIEGGTGRIGATLFQAYDPDSSDLQVQFRITTAPANGYLARSTDGGVTLSKIGVGGAFTQRDVTNGYIYYIHDGSDGYQSSTTGYADRFLFTIADGDKEQPGREFQILVTPANDAPTVTGGPSGLKLIESGNSVYNRVTGLTVSDTDIGTVAGYDDSTTAPVDENSFMRTVVRLRDSSGALLTDYTGVTIGYAAGSGAGVVGGYDGNANGLVLEGSLAQVNAALAGLSVTFTADLDRRYTLEVIADDRNRTAGTLDDADGGTAGTQPRANGGTVNEGDTAVPAADPDPLSGDFSVAALQKNVGIRQITLYASRSNDPPTVTYAGSAITPSEDTAVTIIDGTSRRLVVNDREAEDTGKPLRVTLTVSNGTLSIGSGDGVTVTGNQTGTLQIQGKVADVQALLDAGVRYQGTLNFNGDDTGVQVTVSDLGAVGDDDDDGTPDTKTASLTIDLGDATDVNDRMALDIGTGRITVSGAGAVAVTLPALDSILADVDDAAETGSPIQVTVRLLKADGSPMAQANYAGVTIGSGASGASVVGGYDGAGHALVLWGTIDQIEAALSGLSLTFANAAGANDDTGYQLQVVVDDRLRDASGALVDGDPGTAGVQATANGGAFNQTNTADATLAPDAVPDTALDPYTATNADLDGIYNVVRAQREVFVSGENDAAAVSATNVSVTEGSATVLLNATNGNLSIADPDDNGGTMTVTLTLDKGSVTTVGGTATVTGGLGTASVTLSGTEAQLNASLQAITVTMPGTGNTNWHGTITATLLVNDGGSTGGRPATISGDTNDSAANPGDYDYADGTSAAMTTTRVFTITVAPENDRPTATSLTATFGPVQEDGNPAGTPLSTLLAGNYSDAADDQSGNGGGNTATALAHVAIIGSSNYVATQGSWQVSDGAGGWINIPVSGLSATSALVFAADRSVRFVPAADYHGTPGTLTLRLADGSTAVTDSASASDRKSLASDGGTGVTGAWSSGSVTVGTTIANVNDRPTATAATLTAVAEDTAIGSVNGATVATIVGSHYSDATDNRTGITGGGNAATSLGGIAIVGNAADPVTQGTWYYSHGGTWTAIGTGAGAPTDAAAILLATADSLRFVPVADYNGTPGSLSVRYADSTVTFSAASDIQAAAADATGPWSLSTTIGTSVSPRNDAPVLSGGAANPTISENAGVATGSTAVRLVTAGTAGVSDIDFATASFGGGTITVSLTDGYRTGDVLELSGAFAGIVASTSGGSGAALVITLASGATEANISGVLEAIQYRSTSDNPTNYGATADLTRAYRIVFNDGNNTNGASDAGGPAALDAATPITGTITFVPNNDPPDAVNDTATLTEDTASVTGNARDNDSDPDNVRTDLTVTAVAFGATGGTVGSALSGAYGSLTLNADGGYTYTLNTADPAVQALRAAGTTLTETFAYTLSDGALTDSATITVTITGVNDAPVAVADSLTATEDGGASTGNVLTNDSDVDSGDSKTVSQVNGAAGNVGASVAGANGYGNFVIAANGAVTYTIDNSKPAVQALHQGQTVTDTVTYQVKDTAGATSTATVTVTITGVNDAPVAANDTGGIAEDAASAATGNVLTNDSDVDTGATRSVTAVTFGATAGTIGAALTGGYGALTLNSDGTWSYSLDSGKPAVQALAAGETLSEAFTYTVTDDRGATATATLTVTITGTNDAPVAVADTGTIAEDAATASTGNVLTNDTDVDTSNTHTVSAVSFGATAGTIGAALTGAYGALTLNANGSWSYSVDNGKPAVQALRISGDTLTETFTYTNRDNSGGTSTSTLTITITGVNDAPVGVADSLTATEDGGASTGNVLTNDSDVDNGDTKTVSQVNGVAGNVGASVAGANGYGNFVIAADGSVTYTIDNSKPAVQALHQGQTVTDTVTYQVKDTAGATSTATVTVTITGVNDAPVAVADTGTIAEDATAAATGNALTNDTDVDTGDTHTVSAVSFGATAGTIGAALTGAYGALTLNANGSWSYSVDNGKPAVQALRISGDTLTETFTYTNRDNSGGTSTSTLTITITGVNDAPVGVADSLTATEDGGTSTGNVLTNDSDVDNGDTKTVSQVNGAAGNVGASVAGANGYGNFVIAADGSVTYTIDNSKPAVQALHQGQTVTDTVTYQVKDTAGATSTATVTVTITGVNDAPVVTADTGSIAADATAAATGNVLTNDSDVDSGDTHSVTAVTFGATAGTVGSALTGGYGVLTLNANGAWSYAVDTANAAVQALAVGQTLTETFTYTNTDNRGGSATSTLTITIGGSNADPVAVADTGAIAEDAAAPATGNVLTNDTDLDTSDTHSVTAVAFGATGGTVGAALAGVYGALTLNADGSWSYAIDNGKAAVQALPAGATLTETFTYTNTDSSGGTSTNSLTVTITGVNDAPVAADDTGSTTEDATAAATGNVLTNDSDVDSGATRSVTGIVSGATAGTIGAALAGGYGALTLNADGSWSYAIDNANAAVQALAAGDTLTDVFTYTVTDDRGATATATLTVTVTGVNDAPVAVADTGAIAEDATTAATGNLLANDTDVDSGATRSVTAVGFGATAGTVGSALTGAYGSLTLDGDGAWSYGLDSGKAAVQALAAGETLTEIFTYTVTDDQGATATATLTVTVTGTNDGPTVTSASLTGAVTEDAAPTTVTTGGSVGFGDIDLTDTHSAGASFQSSSNNGPALGTLSASLTRDTTGTGTGGAVEWTYSAANAGLQALAGGDTVTETHRITLSDGKGGTVTQDVTITITGVNDAPVLAPAAPALTTTEDSAAVTTTVAALLGSTASDVDRNAQSGIAVTGALPGGIGAWGYSTDGGATWKSLSGVSAGGALLLRDTDLVRFEPGGVSGGTASLSFRAWDRTSGTAGGIADTTANGGSTAFSTGANTLTLAVAEVNDAPTAIAAIPDRTTPEDSPFAFQLPGGVFADIDPGDRLTYAATLADGSPLPSWLGFDPATGLFSGTPLNEHVGVLSLRVSATDGGGASASVTFALTVVNVNDAPTVEGPPAEAGGTAGQPVGLSIDRARFADVDLGDRLNFTATLADGSPLPSWLRFDPDSLGFAGTPPSGVSGEILVSLRATDLAGAFTTLGVRFTIAAEPTVSEPPATDPTVTAVPPTAVPPTAVPTTVPTTAATPTSDPRTPVGPLVTLVDGTGNPTPSPGTPATAVDGAAVVTSALTASGFGSDAVLAASGLNRDSGGSGLLSTDALFRQATSANLELFLAGSVGNQTMLPQQQTSFQVPPNIFRHTNPGETLTYQATRPDGSPLPNWLEFDAPNLAFKGVPPAEAKGSVDIVIVAKDGRGNQAAAQFRILVTQDLATDTPVNKAQKAAGERNGPPADGDAAPGPQPEPPQPPSPPPADQPTGEQGDDARPAPERRADLAPPDANADVESFAGLSDGAVPAGRAAFSAQLHAAGRGGLLAEARALLNHLLLAADTDRDAA